MTDKEKIVELVALLDIACTALHEHGDESTIPYLEKTLKKVIDKKTLKEILG